MSTGGITNGEAKEGVSIDFYIPSNTERAFPARFAAQKENKKGFSTGEEYICSE